MSISPKLNTTLRHQVCEIARDDVCCVTREGNKVNFEASFNLSSNLQCLLKKCVEFPKKQMARHETDVIFKCYVTYVRFGFRFRFRFLFGFLFGLRYSASGSQPFSCESLVSVMSRKQVADDFCVPSGVPWGALFEALRIYGRMNTPWYSLKLKFPFRSASQLHIFKEIV